MYYKTTREPDRIDAMILNQLVRECGLVPVGEGTIIIEDVEAAIGRMALCEVGNETSMREWMFVLLQAAAGEKSTPEQPLEVDLTERHPGLRYGD